MQLFTSHKTSSTVVQCGAIGHLSWSARFSGQRLKFAMPNGSPSHTLITKHLVESVSPLLLIATLWRRSLMSTLCTIASRVPTMAQEKQHFLAVCVQTFTVCYLIFHKTIDMCYMGQNQLASMTLFASRSQHTFAPFCSTIHATFSSNQLSD